MLVSVSLVLITLSSFWLPFSNASHGKSVRPESFSIVNGTSILLSEPSASLTSDQAPTITPPPAPITTSQCGAGTTINAQNANLLYWDTYIHTWAMSRGYCKKSGQTISGGSIWITGSFNSVNGPTRTYHAASTVVANLSVPTVTSTETSSWTIYTAPNASGSKTAVASFTTTETVTITSSNAYFPQLYPITVAVQPTDKPVLTIISATRLIYYGEIELEEATKVAGGCVRSISTKILKTPFAEQFLGDPISSWAGNSSITASMPTYDLSSIAKALNIQDAIAGTYRGLPTVAVASYSAYIFYCFPDLPHQHLTSESGVLSKPTHGNPSLQSGASIVATPVILTPESGIRTTDILLQAQASPPIASPALTAAPSPGSSLSQEQPAPAAAAAPSASGSEGTPLLPIPVNGLPPGPAEQPSFPVMTIGSQTVFANSRSQFLVNSQTMTPGHALTVSGRTFDMDPSGDNIIVNSISTFAIPSSVSDHFAPAAGKNKHQLFNLATPATITLFNTPIILEPSFPTPVLIDGQTLTPGGAAITISGTCISLAASDSALIFGNETTVLSNPSSSPPAITFGGVVVTENSQSDFVIGGETLAPGGVITVDGTILSLAPGASDIVIGSSLISLEPVSKTSAAESTASQTAPPTGRLSDVGSFGTQAFPNSNRELNVIAVVLGCMIMALVQ